MSLVSNGVGYWNVAGQKGHSTNDSGDQYERDSSL